MELTLEQQSAIQRGEAVSLRFPNLEVECVVIDKQRFLAMEEEALFQQDMQRARNDFKKSLPSQKLRELASRKKPPQAWFDEDFSDLMPEAS